MKTASPGTARPARRSGPRARAWRPSAPPLARLSAVAFAVILVAYFGISFNYAERLSRVDRTSSNVRRHS